MEQEKRDGMKEEEQPISRERGEIGEDERDKEKDLEGERPLHETEQTGR